MKHTLSKTVAILLLLLVALSCQPQPDEQPLTTDLDLTQLERFESVKYGLSFGIPEGWQVVESDISIHVGPDVYATHTLDDAEYRIRTMPRRFGLGRVFPRSAYEIASIIKNPSLDPSSWSIEPITRTTVSGRPGAYYLEEVLFSSSRQYYVDYVIVIELNDDEVVILSADGPKEMSELMRSTLNAIALTVQPLDN